MDHQEKHHEQHRKEREHEIHSHAVHAGHAGHADKKDMLPFHPAWLVVLGTVLVLVAMAIWIMLV
jgi:hypothetical protein